MKDQRRRQHKVLRRKARMEKRMKNNGRGKNMETNKRLIMPFIKDILCRQKNGEEIAYMFFYGADDLYMVVCNTMITTPIGENWQSFFRGMLWAIINHQPLDKIKIGKKYRKEIEPFLPALHLARECGKYPFIFTFDENADIFLNVCGVEIPTPMVENEHTAYLRMLVHKLYPLKYSVDA